MIELPEQRRKQRRRRQGTSGRSRDELPGGGERGIWKNVFSFDFRSLALFRILAAVTLILDLALRWPTRLAMYTDSGYFTREFAAQYYRDFFDVDFRTGVWSLHWLSGSLAWQHFLFALAAVFAVMMLIGYWTRLATVCSWILLASLHARNPILLTSGDTILKLVLFWSMFLPLGRVWSIDSIRAAGKKFRDGSYFSLATVGFLFQLFLMYFFTGVAKWNSDWLSGEAMQYVLRLNIYVLPWGRELLQLEWLLPWITWATLAAEVFLIWLLFCPWMNGLCRWLLLIVFWGFHIGIGCTMSIGLFPWICVVIWVPLVPGCFWVRLKNRFVRGTGPCDIGAGEIETPHHSIASVLAGAFLIGVMILELALNVGNIDHPVCKKFLPRAAIPPIYWLNLDQRFQMFGRPPKMNPWFVYEAQLASGEFTDLMKQPESTHGDRSSLHRRPENLRLNLVPHHWRKLHRNLVHPQRASLRQQLVDYAVQDWNRRHGPGAQVMSARLYCYLEPTTRDANPGDRESTVWGVWESPSTEALNKKIDSQLDQLLENMGLPGY